MDKLNRLLLEAQNARLHQTTRRHFLKESAMGLGALALGSLMGGCGSSLVSNPAFDAAHPLLPKAPMFPGKAKSVIYIHMAGAPSQLELFNYKPDLMKLDGLDCPPSLLEGKKFAFIRGVPKMLGPQAVFKQSGESGIWTSNYLPHLSSMVDDIALINSVTTEQFNHAPAQLLFHTGTPRLGRPSIGSWVTYGLGTVNQNLPAFVVLTSGGRDPDAGKSVWGSGFLPSVYQGVQCRNEGDPVLFINDPKGMDRDLRKASIEAINEVNKEEFTEYQDPETLSRIAQYEMAYKMQITAPEVMNINNEPEYIRKMYGVEDGKNSFANNVLLARKLVENGVRFVQLFDWGWDSHGTDTSTALDIGLMNKCRTVDRPITALLQDLKQRGLLDETLVIWGAEFGRTPMQENREGKPLPFKGRDHHVEAFSMWMAGGGIKGGVTYGETDEIGYSVTKNRVQAYDIQATILNQLGFNHEEFTYQYQGRGFRLTDLYGHVLTDLIA